jgi:hypothetical protein
MPAGHQQLIAIIVGVAILVAEPTIVIGSELSNESPTWTKQGMLKVASSNEQEVAMLGAS